MEHSRVENHVSPDGWNIQSGRQWNLHVRDGDLENKIIMSPPPPTTATTGSIDVYTHVTTGTDLETIALQPRSAQRQIKAGI